MTEGLAPLICYVFSCPSLFLKNKGIPIITGKAKKNTIQLISNNADSILIILSIRFPLIIPNKIDPIQNMIIFQLNLMFSLQFLQILLIQMGDGNTNNCHIFTASSPQQGHLLNFIIFCDCLIHNVRAKARGLPRRLQRFVRRYLYFCPLRG